MLRSLYARHALCAAVLAVASSAHAQVQFNNFSNTSSLQLNGNASPNTNPIDGSVLRVTSNNSGEAGSAFVKTPFNLASGFSTFFTFRISGFDNSGFYGADGMLFLVQNDPRGSTALGIGGGSLGFADPDNSPGVSIQNSAGIEFDTFGNGNYNDPDSSHVALDLNGSVTHSTNPADPTFPASSPADLKNQGLWYTWIDFNGSTIELRMSQDGVRPTAPTLSEPLTLNAAQTYFPGFTASTGGGTENHDILNWSFTNSYNPYGSVANVFTDAHADGNFLAGASTGDWSNPNSWIEHQVPTNGTNTYLETFASAYTLNVGAGTNAVAQNVTIHGSDSAPVTLAIHDGGTLNVAADFKAGTDGASAATITVDGAGSQLNVVGSLYLSSNGTASTIAVTHGGALTSLDAHVGSDNNQTSSVSVDGVGSTWTLRQYLYVGENGAAGSVSFTSGAMVNDAESHIGYTSLGTALIDHSTWHTDNTLYVGEYGPASSVTAQNGSLVEAYNVQISHDTGSTLTPSTVTIDGNDSHFNIAADIVVGGQHGNGMLTISNGAAASSTNLYIAGSLPDSDPAAATDDANSIGAVIVDGASLDNSSGSTVVGRNGMGKFILKNGGQAVSDSAVIGDNSTGVGQAVICGNVSGAPSTWRVNNELNVGFAGAGSLMVLNGAELDSADGVIARNPGSAGAATVSGINSKWFLSDNLSVGGTSSDAGGSGQLTISDGGYILANTMVHVWPGNSILLQNGGVLQGFQAVIDGTLQITDGSAVGVYSVTGNGSISIANNASLVAANVHIPQLTADATAGLYLQFNSGTPSPSRIGSLTITNGGIVDLDNNPLILDYTTSSPLSAVRGYLHDGLMKSASATNDPQQRTGLAYVEASNLLGITGTQTAMWFGETVDATTLLIKYTYLGDANLDGKINADDYALIDRGFAKHLAAGNAYWTDGDFNYDGLVTSADYLIIDRDFALQSGTLSPAFLAQREAQFGDAYVTQLLTSIPEPSMAALILCTMLMPPRKKKPRM